MIAYIVIYCISSNIIKHDCKMNKYIATLSRAVGRVTNSKRCKHEKQGQKKWSKAIIGLSSC